MIASNIGNGILGVLLGMLLSTGPAPAQVAYDASSEIVSTTHQRSDYYTQVQGAVWAASIDEFLQEADRDVPVVVHAHGCSGLSSDDGLLRSFYVDQGANVVMMNFLNEKGRKPSCEPYPKAGGWPEVANPDRIRARRMELESQVRWLKDRGFNKIYVSGHSEGGRTVQGLKSEVAAVFIHGMDCKIGRMEFWVPNPKNRIMVFISSKDPWLDYPNSMVRGCKSLFNRDYVEEYWSDRPTHSPLAEQEWRDVISRELTRKSLD